MTHTQIPTARPTGHMQLTVTCGCGLYKRAEGHSIREAITQAFEHAQQTGHRMEFTGRIEPRSHRQT